MSYTKKQKRKLHIVKLIKSIGGKPVDLERSVRRVEMKKGRTQ